nr:Clp protease N-terminal domain-containing protein [Amycolatopsis taiwanensis]
MFERFTVDARTVVILAEEHARRLGHRYIGCEHLLLAVASTSAPASAVLCEQGVTPEHVEEEIVRHVNLGGAAGLSSDLDRDALSAIGIDLDARAPVAPNNRAPHQLQTLPLANELSGSNPVRAGSEPRTPGRAAVQGAATPASELPRARCRLRQLSQPSSETACAAHAPAWTSGHPHPWTLETIPGQHGLARCRTPSRAAPTDWTNRPSRPPPAGNQCRTSRPRRAATRRASPSHHRSGRSSAWLDRPRRALPRLPRRHTRQEGHRLGARDRSETTPFAPAGSYVLTNRPPSGISRFCKC